MYLGISTWKREYRPAKYFVIATSFFIIGTLLHPLSFWNIIPFSIDDLTKYKVLDVSGLAMIFLFSLALADRINIIQEEREAARIEAIDNLKHADKLKDEFLSNTSHELRTPLNGIIGLAESLLDGVHGDIPGEARRDLQLVAASAKRLTGLVNDILDFSLLKNKDITLQLKQVDLWTVVDTIIIITTPLVGDKDVRLINGVSKGSPLLLADENRLQQVMYNLVGNALKFTNKGSVTIGAEYSETVCKIAVSDTGIGIPEEVRATIFNAFEQGDSSISRKYGGTGIGLAITKHLVELHGGSIIANSVEGEGSVFMFTIPVYNENAARKVLDDQVMTDKYNSVDRVGPYAVEKADNRTLLQDRITDQKGPVDHEKTGKTDSARLTVLVVDDDEINLHVLENILSLANYNVKKASNGNQALQSVKKQLPDLILLDIMMPGMSGYEVSRRLREDYSIFELPIIMLTAKNMIPDILTGFESGANDYLSKPFNKVEMLARIKTLIDLKQSVNESKKLLVIQDQLTLAKEIQNTTLPKEFPHLKHFELSASYLPADQIGGDFYNYYIINENKIAAMIVDVVGHGIPAALITFMVKVVFDVLQHLKMQPDRILSQMNKILFGNIKHLYMTAGYIAIDMDSKKMLYSRAGHEPLLLYKRNDDTCYFYRPKGYMIGLLPSNNLELEKIDIEPGDRIILYTDCVTDCVSKDGIVYGMERLMDFIKNNSDLSIRTLNAAIIQDLKEWSGNDGDFDDDLTMVIIDIK